MKYKNIMAIIYVLALSTIIINIILDDDEKIKLTTEPIVDIEDNKSDGKDDITNSEETNNESIVDKGNEQEEPNSNPTDENTNNETIINNNNNNNSNNENIQNNTSNNNNTNNNNNNNNNDPTITNPEPETPIVETEEEKNDKKRKEIESKYGIKILYGDEIGSYRPKNLTPTKMNDPEQIGYYLDEINAVLSTYPSNFFQDFINKGMPLTIYLIESIEYNVFVGFFDREFFSDLKLTMTATYFFRRTLNHEIMHYIDAYLEIVMYPNNPYDEWLTLNPLGYVYGTNIDEYNYHIINKTTGAYFLESYGQTHEKEDRATFFEDMMSRAYKPNGCYDEGEPIRKKAELLGKQIETYFPSVSPNTIEHWERFIQ